VNILTDELDVYLVYVKEGKIIARQAIPAAALGKIAEQIFLHQAPDEIEIDENLWNEFCNLVQKHNLSVAVVAKLLRTSEDEIIDLMDGQRKLFKNSLIVDLSSLVDRLK
jgi:predicted XRE-type DNA-binding protein